MPMRKAIVGLLLAAVGLSAEELPPGEAEKLRCVHETFAAVGERVWPGWSAAPFGVVLIAGETEYFVAPTGEVTRTRPRVFNPRFLATFPVMSSEPAIVVGTAKGSGRSDSGWIITLLHEHFHQLQYSQPGYYERTAGLGLAKGDTSGMWMLNYPFPYADAKVQKAYDRFAHALAAALRARNSAAFAPALREVKSSWRAMRAMLSADDYTYLRFQLWQEGFARYAELLAAQNAGSVACLRSYEPSIDTLSAQIMKGIYASLDDPKLGERQREVVYAAGAAIALLLDETSPDWKSEYFRQPFELERYFAP